MVYDNNIFKFFYIDTVYRQNKLCPRATTVFGISTNLGRVKTKGTFLPSYTEIGSLVYDINILKFSVKIYRENKLCPLAAMFFFYVS